MTESSVTLRLAHPNYVVCVDLMVCLGYSSTGASSAFRQYPSYTMIRIPSHNREIAVVDLTDAKNWLEKKSDKNPKADIVLGLLPNVDYSQNAVIIPLEMHTQSTTSDNESEAIKSTMLDAMCEKQTVSNIYCSPRSFTGAMAEVKEFRQQCDLRIAEINQRQAERALVIKEVLETKAEIEFYLAECEKELEKIRKK